MAILQGGSSPCSRWEHGGPAPGSQGTAAPAAEMVYVRPGSVGESQTQNAGKRLAHWISTVHHDAGPPIHVDGDRFVTRATATAHRASDHADLPAANDTASGPRDMAQRSNVRGPSRVDVGALADGSGLPVTQYNGPLGWSRGYSNVWTSAASLEAASHA